MNRSIALFVALVVLLAHVLAIHNDGEGNFAFPYDQAYVVFRLARHLVREGELAWNLGAGGFESYPSALWLDLAYPRRRPASRTSTGSAMPSKACGRKLTSSGACRTSSTATGLRTR